MTFSADGAYPRTHVAPVDSDVEKKTPCGPQMSVMTSDQGRRLRALADDPEHLERKAELARRLHGLAESMSLAEAWRALHPDARHLSTRACKKNAYRVLTWARKNGIELDPAKPERAAADVPDQPKPEPVTAEPASEPAAVAVQPTGDAAQPAPLDAIASAHRRHRRVRDPRTGRVVLVIEHEPDEPVSSGVPPPLWAPVYGDGLEGGGEDDPRNSDYKSSRDW